MRDQDGYGEHRQGLEQVALRAHQPAGQLADWRPGLVPGAAVMTKARFAASNHRWQQHLNQGENKRPGEDVKFCRHGKCQFECMNSGRFA